MRKSYWLLMPATLFLLFYIIYYFGAIPVIYFLDLPGILLMLLVLLMAFCTYRPSEVAGYCALAFRKDHHDRAEVEKALHFFRTVQAYMFYMAGLTFIIALIYILAFVPDLSNTGPQIAVALITIFYALLGTFFVTLPFRAGLQKIKTELDAAS